jgi:PilZ domain
MRNDPSLIVKKHKGHLIFEQKNRKFTRIHFDRQVRLIFTSDSYDCCRIKDLSMSGMFVYGAFQEQIGEQCHINLIQRGSSTTLTFQASGKVARKNDKGVAIEFVTMSFDSYMFLQTTLIYEVEDPLSIGHEFPENSPFQITDQFPTELIVIA